MVNICCFCGLTSGEKLTDLSFHRLPRDPNLCNIWLRFFNKLDWTPTPNVRICSTHFSEHSFRRVGPYRRKRLILNAVPTILHPKVSYSKMQDLIETISSLPTTVVIKTENAEYPNARSPSPQPQPTTSCHLPSAMSNYQRPDAFTKSTVIIREKCLMREIDKLKDCNALKAKKIKYMRSQLWKAKKRIESLSLLVDELKKQNKLITDDVHHFMS